MSSDLPSDLVRRADLLFERFDQGVVLSLDELERHLMEAVHEFALDEYARSRSDRVKDTRFDRATWEDEFEAKQQAVAEVTATLALTVAREYEHATGLVEWVFSSPHWRQALEPVTSLLAEAGEDGPDSVAAITSMARLAAERGVLPAAARHAVRGALLGSEMSLVDLLESDREGNAARVSEIITEAGGRGCVTPALRVLRLRRAEGRTVDAAGLSALLDPEELAACGEFGGVTHIAVELLADQADTEALKWTSAVTDAALFHSPGERPGIRAGGETFEYLRLDRQNRDHVPNWCVPLCSSGDARLLGVLAAVDWLAGNDIRAQARAVDCIGRAGSHNWSASGAELLAEWVTSRPLEPTERSCALYALIAHGERAHVDLGLLGMQIHGELADLATATGNREMASLHVIRADWYKVRPEMRLHFESFQFPALLARLPRAN